MRMSPDQNRRRLLAVLGGMLVATPALAGSRLLAGHIRKAVVADESGQGSI